MAKILIADDDHDVLRLIQHLLNENGYETCEATNGLAALNFFEHQFFDLIITDLKMPRMDGMSFLREVKQLEPMIPVIVLTAFASAETAAEAVNNCAFSFLSKPFKVDELLCNVARALGSEKTKQRATAACA